MSAVARKGLVAALRSRISDDRPSVLAFNLACSDTSIKSAILELANGYLITTLEGAQKARPLRLNLSLPSYSTVRGLYTALSTERGYLVTSDGNFRGDHLSSELVVVEGAMREIGGGSTATLRHAIFSDAELVEYLAEAINFHNPNYNINTVPDAEQGYVLLKAAARAFRVLAADTVKRMGLDSEPTVLMELARDLEGQYDKEVKRKARILPSPKIDESAINTGDIIQGTLTRRSLRAGYTTPYRGATPPEVPTLLDPGDDDVEDVVVRIRWKQDRDESFSYYELWRDTVPEVERSVAGRLPSTNTSGRPGLPVATQFSRPSTSKQVFGLARGGNRVSPVFDGFFFWTAAEMAGSNIVNVAFTDGVVQPNAGGAESVLGEPLEPETYYYYRLYAVNWNGEVQHSNVIRVRTRAIRAKFARTGSTIASDAIDPVVGTISGGTSITIKGTNMVEGTKVFLGGKLCTETSRTLTEMVVTSPGMTNTDFVGRFQDMVLVSPSGLRDIATQAFTYSA